jgi:hypothetical protein
LVGLVVVQIERSHNACALSGTSEGGSFLGNGLLTPRRTRMNAPTFSHLAPIVVIIHTIFVISLRRNVTRASSSCHIFSIHGAVDLNT